MLILWSVYEFWQHVLHGNVVIMNIDRYDATISIYLLISLGLWCLGCHYKELTLCLFTLIVLDSNLCTWLFLVLWTAFPDKV